MAGVRVLSGSIRIDGGIKRVELFVENGEAQWLTPDGGAAPSTPFGGGSNVLDWVTLTLHAFGHATPLSLCPIPRAIVQELPLSTSGPAPAVEAVGGGANEKKTIALGFYADPLGRAPFGKEYASGISYLEVDVDFGAQRLDRLRWYDGHGNSVEAEVGHAAHWLPTERDSDAHARLTDNLVGKAPPLSRDEQREPDELKAAWDMVREHARPAAGLPVDYFALATNPAADKNYWLRRRLFFVGVGLTGSEKWELRFSTSFFASKPNPPSAPKDSTGAHLYQHHTDTPAGADLPGPRPSSVAWVDLRPQQTPNQNRESARVIDAWSAAMENIAREIDGVVPASHASVLPAAKPKDAANKAILAISCRVETTSEPAAATTSLFRVVPGSATVMLLTYIGCEVAAPLQEGDRVWKAACVGPIDSLGPDERVPQDTQWALSTLLRVDAPLGLALSLWLRALPALASSVGSLRLSHPDGEDAKGKWTVIVRSVRRAPTGTKTVRLLGWTCKGIVQGIRVMPIAPELTGEERASSVTSGDRVDAFRRPPPLLLVHRAVVGGDKSSEPSLPGVFHLRSSEGSEPGLDHQLELELLADETANGGEQYAVTVLDPAPFGVYRLEIPALKNEVEGGPVAVWNSAEDGGSRWKLVRSAQTTTITFPPQGLAEAMVTSAFPSLPFDARFTTLTQVSVDSAFDDARYGEAPWNMRHHFGYAEQRIVGSRARRLDTELLYGLRATAEDLAGVYLAEAEASLGRTVEGYVDATTHAGGGDDDSWPRVWQQVQTRLGVAELVDATHTPVTIERNLHWAVREKTLLALPAEAGRTLPKEDREKAEALGIIAPKPEDGFHGGWIAGIEQGSHLKEVLRERRSDRGLLERLRFAALGGWGVQKTSFSHDVVSVGAEAAAGRTHTYSVTYLGRIAVTWNRAKLVILYERTTGPTWHQTAGDGETFPALRLIEKYVEIMEPSRLCRETGADVAASGPVLAVHFRTVRIRVDSPTETISEDEFVVPLHPRGQPHQPHVQFELAGDPRAETSSTLCDCTNVDEMLFYSHAKLGGSGPPVFGIDYGPMPAAQPPADPRGDRRPPAVQTGLERFTFALALGSNAANLIHGRATGAVGAFLANVSLMREPVVAAAAPAAFAAFEHALGLVDDIAAGDVQRANDALKKLGSALPSSIKAIELGERTGAAFDAVHQELQRTAAEVEALTRDTKLEAEELQASVVQAVHAMRASLDDFGSLLPRRVSAPLAGAEGFLRNALALFAQDIAKLSHDKQIALVAAALHEVERSQLPDAKGTLAELEADLGALRSELEKEPIDELTKRWQGALKKLEGALPAWTRWTSKKPVDEAFAGVEALIGSLGEPTLETAKKLANDVLSKVVQAEGLLSRLEAEKGTLLAAWAQMKDTDLVPSVREAAAELGKLLGASPVDRRAAGIAASRIARSLGAAIQLDAGIPRPITELAKAAPATLNILRAFGKSPEAAGMAFSRAVVAYAFRSVRDAVWMTPAIAQYRGILAETDALRAFAADYATQGIWSDLVPYVLDGRLPKLRELFPWFVGIVAAAVGDIDVPSLAGVRITHDFDKALQRATADVKVEMPLGRSVSLAEVAGAFRIELQAGTFRADSRLALTRAGRSTVQARGEIEANWALFFADVEVLRLEQAKLRFDESGHVDFDFNPKNIRLPSVLDKMLEAVRNMMPLDSLPPLRVLEDEKGPMGIALDIELPIPAANALTSGIVGLTFGLSFRLRARPHFALGVGFHVSSRESPFVFSIFILGGAGHIRASADIAFPTGAHGLLLDFEASLAASASLAIALGPVTGQVLATLGLDAVYRTGQPLSMAVVYTLSGRVDVRGILSVYIGIRMAVQLEGSTLRASGTLSISVRFTRFFKFTFTRRLEYSLEMGKKPAKRAAIDGPGSSAKSLTDTNAPPSPYGDLQAMYQQFALGTC